MSACAYCGVRRAVNQDHVIPRMIVKRQNADLRRPSIPADLLVTVPSCFDCNMRKGVRRLVPPSWKKHLSRLNKLQCGTWRVWDGSAEGLRETVR